MSSSARTLVLLRIPSCPSRSRVPSLSLPRPRWVLGPSRPQSCGVAEREFRRTEGCLSLCALAFAQHAVAACSAWEIPTDTERRGGGASFQGDPSGTAGTQRRARPREGSCWTFGPGTPSPSSPPFTGPADSHKSSLGAMLSGCHPVAAVIPALVARTLRIAGDGSRQLCRTPGTRGPGAQAEGGGCERSLWLGLRKTHVRASVTPRPCREGQRT